jgi:hypothetical protein
MWPCARQVNTGVRASDAAAVQSRLNGSLIPVSSFSSDLTNLANAFTRSGLVKHFWNLNGSEGQPFGPAPPDAGTELIPSGTLQPTTASWQAEPGETKPPWVRIGPFRFGNSGAGQPPTRQPRDITSDGRDVVNGGTKSAGGHARRSAVLAALPHPRWCERHPAVAARVDGRSHSGSRRRSGQHLGTMPDAQPRLDADLDTHALTVPGSGSSAGSGP